MGITSLDDAAWDSPWRRRHVGEKVAVSLGLVLTALLSPIWPGCLLVATAALVCMIGFARIPVRVVAVAMAAPTLFLTIGAAAVLVSLGEVPPDAGWHWGVLSITPASTATAAQVLAHGIAGTLAVLLLATTTPLVDMLTWLRGLRIPDPLLEVASLTYRLVFVVLETLLLVREAQRARLGDVARGGLRRRFETTTSLVATVALRSWERSTRLHGGLTLRGYEGALTTLPISRALSPAFLLLTGVGLGAIWLASAVVLG